MPKNLELGLSFSCKETSYSGLRVQPVFSAQNTYSWFEELSEILQPSEA